MKRILLAKEWAGMRPFAWLLLVMLGLDLLDLGTSNLADLHYKQTLFDPSTWIEDAILPLLLAFAMGSGLLAREVEDGTLAFLDGLPVRRRDVFLANLAVAGACLFAYAVSAPLLGWTVHHLLRNSVTEPVGAAALGWLAVRYMLLVGAGLALGLLFGFVRYLAWALLAIAAAAVVVLKRSAPRIGSALDPTQLIAEGWSTHGLGSDTVWTIAVLALACTALAWLLFAHAGGAGMQRLARLAQRRSVALILGGAGLVAVPVAFHQALAPDTETEGRHGDDTCARTRARARSSTCSAGARPQIRHRALHLQRSGRPRRRRRRPGGRRCGVRHRSPCPGDRAAGCAAHRRRPVRQHRAHRGAGRAQPHPHHAGARLARHAGA
jgi:hypothetical protein